jgi:dipeptidyl aminopeptidase/acylaminoacyl peptidase
MSRYNANTVLLWAGLVLLTLTSCDRTGPVAEAAVQRLAYIGGDGNVYVTTTADLQARQRLTKDAEVAAELQGLSYHRLAWSRAGWLAFAAVHREGNRAESKLYVLPALDRQPILVGESDRHFVIYNYWSPTPCLMGDPCQQMVYLIEEKDDIALRLLTIAGSEVTNERVGQGWPFYTSWSPDGRSLLWRTGWISDGAVTQYTVAPDQREVLPLSPGGFLAPAWSPTGDGYLVVTREGDRNKLQYFGGDSVRTITAEPGSSIAFAWSPDGRQVAYMVRARENDPFYGPIHLYDRDTGLHKRVTDGGLRPTAFFWSPDSQQLAYLTWVPVEQNQLNQLRLLDLRRETDRGLELFSPSPLMRFALNSFNQYAQSHRFWSADGRYFVYAARESDNRDKIWVIDMRAGEESRPVFIDEGSIGYWSW